MRSFFRALMATLRAIRWVAVTTIRVGGKLVTLLAPSSPVEQPISADIGFEDVQPEAPERESRYARIQELARELVRNPETPSAAMVRGVEPSAAIWLAAMPHEMLLRISLASEAALADHISGRQSIRGVLSYDSESVRDFQRATVVPEPWHTSDTELASLPSM